MSDRPVKMVLVVRRDVSMRRGKEISQGGHGFMAWMLERLAEEPNQSEDREETCLTGYFSEPEIRWMRGQYRKITLQAQTERELRELHKKAVDLGISAHLVTDLGATEFHGIPTVTALAIGPDWSDYIDQVTGPDTPGVKPY